ncbi:hypothetical protein ABEV74_20000 [Paenibacillus cisolokensis]|uniref:hypothetical protein n=1 Tax=Paenibacillus cisolokensis TaxID=1658519 RepID=UPI003D2AB6DF
MTRNYTLKSPNGTRLANLIESPEGIRLELHAEGERLPYYDGHLDRMLLASTGRPWDDEPVRPERPAIELEDGRIRMKGSVRGVAVTLDWTFDDRGLLHVTACWTNRGDRVLQDAAFGLAFGLGDRDGEKITIPHMIYNNNPSADPQRVVPKLGTDQGFVCEEHRLPIPCANAEWTEGGEPRFLSLFTIPSFTETEDGAVHYGSLGVLRRGGRSSLAVMSGVLMFNGDKDVYYTGKSKTEPYAGGYVRLGPGESLKKRYVLDWGRLPQPGWGFREAVRKGRELFRPQSSRPLTLDDIVRLKTNALDDRWREENGAAGYVKFNDSNDFGKVSRQPFHFLYGWTGQCLKLAWCDAKLGFDGGDEERISRCGRAVDFYIQGSATSVPGLRSCSYELESRTWGTFNLGGRRGVSSRAYGETIADLADIVLLYRERGRETPEAWTTALREAADWLLGSLLPSGIYPAGWLTDGAPCDDMTTAAGIPCVVALIKAHRVTGDARYLRHAEETFERYYDLHARTFDRPFARSTLDARCEDKEAGMYYFIAAFELFALTGDDRYRERAEVAADWLLTFVYVWNPAYDRGSPLRDNGFYAVGWPGVSVQNHHLDVFFPAYEMWRFGRMTGNAEYADAGRQTLDAMGQGICTSPGEWGFTVVGEQGEGFYQTHYHQRGHSNVWNPSWVIALVLANALRLRDEAEYRRDDCG